ncbi:MAG: response regulator transcription factor [Nevskia sp.]|jgi:DNA-binding NarL/FixJ family response regulator|nr:response regulator transcription factor [Nevskia sp.]MCK9384124.1 response regulator transcription factor [Nevskia sp.]
MKTFRTLLVDDNEAFLVLARHLLATVPEIEVIGLGHDGYDAVRLAEELRPDLILMDLSMPGMSGLQATRLIKAQDAPPHILITSHYDDAEHREHTAQAGADGFISKHDYEQRIADYVRGSMSMGGSPNG